MKNKIYVVGNSGFNYLNWLIPMGFKLTNNLEEAGTIFFTGGSDVSPVLYGEKIGSRIGDNPERDEYESEIYNQCKDKNKIGVCRGGQFLTVMSGYRIVQHMSHPWTHDTHTNDGKVLESTSTHHNQFLLRPSGIVPALDFNLIGWAKKLSPYHLDGNDNDYNFGNDYKEPEIVVYNDKENNTKSLAIQMHPEMFDLNHPTIAYLQNLVRKEKLID